MMKSIFLSFSFFVTVAQASVGLDYLNSLRSSAGMPLFASQTHLDKAAQNHSAYMKANNIFGHYEDTAKTGYTGDYAPSRVLYTGYQHKMVGENVSAGQSSVESSIDGLMSAIYHRFGFLSLEVDEIGIGVDSQYYTYDMGNSVLLDLCTNESYTGGSYYLPCANGNIKVESASYEGRADHIKAASPDLILWPSIGGENIPPVFYEEFPDPLPNDSVTGYPVSVEFNSDFFSSSPTVDSFVLKDENGNTYSALVNMNQSNDPNKKFSTHQFALFPEKRLEWGSIYNVDLSYTYEGANYAKNWCFSTRSLSNEADRFYRIEKNTYASLKVISGKSYAIYVLPNHTNDTLGGVSYSYNSDKVTFRNIDRNTFVVTISGNTGEYAKFTFGNSQEITLTIDTTDTATVPASRTCAQVTDTDGDGILDSEDLDDDNDGYSDIIEKNTKSNPLDANDTPLDTDKDMIPDSIDTDDDNDGISDSDERANGLNPLNASDGKADFDGDGFSNAIEISVGSDIRDATSKPTWKPVMMGDIVILVPSFL